MVVICEFDSFFCHFFAVFIRGSCNRLFILALLVQWDSLFVIFIFFVVFLVLLECFGRFVHLCFCWRKVFGSGFGFGFVMS
jgi:hypothetical protein